MSNELNIFHVMDQCLDRVPAPKNAIFLGLNEYGFFLAALERLGVDGTASRTLKHRGYLVVPLNEISAMHAGYIHQS